MFDPRDKEVLTFDCYGTLIDWETGIAAALGGEEEFDVVGIAQALAGSKEGTVRARPAGAKPIEFRAVVRVDTPKEVEYYRHGGILQYVLRQLLK